MPLVAPASRRWIIPGSPAGRRSHKKYFSRFKKIPLNRKVQGDYDAACFAYPTGTLAGGVAAGLMAFPSDFT